MDLVTARVAKRKTQWDLRLDTGINQSKISLIENGYVEPNEHEKVAIAKALGVQVDDIQWSPETAQQ